MRQGGEAVEEMCPSPSVMERSTLKRFHFPFVIRFVGQVDPVVCFDIPLVEIFRVEAQPGYYHTVLQDKLSQRFYSKDPVDIVVVRKRIAP